MTDANSPPSNLERLKRHLKVDCLAARLVGAQMSAGADRQQAELKKVLSDRLNELRQEYGGTTDHKD